MRVRIITAIALVACLGLAAAPAQAKKSTSQRIAALEKAFKVEHKKRVAAERKIQAIAQGAVDSDMDFQMFFFGCVFPQGLDEQSTDPTLPPYLYWSASTAPAIWALNVAGECVDTQAQASGVRKGFGFRR